MLEWVFGALAAGFCIAAVIIWAVNRRWRDIIAHIKATGERYEAEITKVYDNLMMRVNFRNPIIVECIYKNRQGQSVLVKSKNIWPPYRMFDRKNIKAAVWVNPSDARDYYVEVFFGDEYNNDPQADYDFR
ncbi:MAG: hypothetical protein LBS19_04815 [Clostridiales bacterium]|nr:hypothetical protein [Clostridiales bacterium]